MNLKIDVENNQLRGRLPLPAKLWPQCNTHYSTDPYELGTNGQWRSSSVVAVGVWRTRPFAIIGRRASEKCLRCVQRVIPRSPNGMASSRENRPRIGSRTSAVCCLERAKSNSGSGSRLRSLPPVPPQHVSKPTFRGAYGDDTRYCGTELKAFPIKCIDGVKLHGMRT